MAHRFDLTPMQAFLRHRKEFFVIDDMERYKRVTVKLHAGGIVLRDRVYGSQLKTKKQQATEAGDLLVAEIDAKVGGVGIVPPELAGAIVSSHYFLYEIDDAICHPKYLEFFIRSGAVEQQFQEFVRGSTNYAAIRAYHTPELQIPLPPLDEQRRIVARIEELAALIEEAQGLRDSATEEADLLIASESGKVFDKLRKEYPIRLIDSFGPHVTSGPRGWKSRYAETGMRFYRAQDIGPNGRIQNQSKAFVRPPRPGERNPERALLQPGDLMLVITGATVGRCSIFPNTCEAGYVNQHVAICRIPQELIDPHFVLWGLRSPMGQEHLLGQQYGETKPGLNLTNIRMLEVPFPPMPEQRRIVTYLDSLQAQVDELTALQAATQAELDALLPSVLDRAFRGEL